ncbi:protein kinase [bacterium]|nr:protein kinase [bacterium]
MAAQTVLVVEDDEELRNLIALVLRDKGHSVTTVSNGIDALKSIASQKPSLMILDLMMKGMSGEEVCKTIKENPVLNDIMIMVLSAKSDLQNRLDCLNLGAEEYLVKPIDLEELATRVGRFLGWMSRWQSAATKAEQPSDTGQKKPDDAANLQQKTLPTIHVPLTPPVVSPAVADTPKQETKSHYGIYRLENLAGTGGMGLVYKAYDEGLDRYVALKVLSKEWSDSPQTLEGFRREAKLIAALNHPGIAQIYTFAEEDGESYFALQWCPGGSLANLIRRKKKIQLLPAIDILLQCSRALEAASLKGVVHRDIKPSNLMFDENQQIKVVDFGIAFTEKLPEKPDESKIIRGSPLYMSPEQGRGERTDHRTDIYSLGITFYQMLYGHLPFSAETPYEWIAKHAEDPFPPYDNLGGEIPPRAYQMIEKMTQKDPGLRYQKYPELITDVEKLRTELYSQRRLKIPRPVKLAATPAIKSDDFFDLLSKIFNSGSTGILKAKWGRLEKQFLILRKEIVSFESPQQDESAWTVLADRKLMRKEDIPSVHVDLEESLNHLLFIQAMTPEDFEATYREIMRQSVMQVFQWAEVQGEFLETRIEHDPFSRISIANILTDAARAVIPYEKISDRVPRNEYIVHAPGSNEILEMLNLPRAESFLVSRLEGENNTVETLRLLTNFSEENICRTVFALEKMKALKYTAPMERRPRRKTEEPAPQPPPIVPEPEAPAPQAPQKKIKDSDRKSKWTEPGPVLNPQTAGKHFKLAEEKYKSGRYYEAERHCVEAIRNNPSEAKYHHLMALSMANHPHSLRVVEESFLKAIELDPKNVEYRLDYAGFLRIQKRLNDAVDECKKILEISPRNEKANNLLTEIALDK